MYPAKVNGVSIYLPIRTSVRETFLCAGIAHLLMTVKHPEGPPFLYHFQREIKISCNKDEIGYMRTKTLKELLNFASDLIRLYPCYIIRLMALVTN